MVSSTFVSKNTVIENLNPITKILAIVTMGIGSLIFPSSWLGFFIILGLFVVAYIAKIVKDFTVVMCGFGIPITIMLLFIQGCYSTKNVTVIMDLGFITIGLEGIVYAIKIITTLLVFMGSFYIMNKTTYIGKMVAALTKYGVPTKVGYLILSSLYVVPQMQNKMAIIKEAQSARGLEIEGGIIGRIKAYIPLLGPVVMSSLIDAQERGMTLETRGFGVKGIRQTSYIEVKTSSLDKIINMILVLLLIAVVVVTLLIKSNII